MIKILNKRLLLAISYVIIVLLSVFTITACGKEDTTKVMSLSLNPEIEFILDKNNKVVTVNAMNDEGNYIAATVEFKGLSAEEAAKEFVEAVKDNGFLIEGEVSASENQLEISVSGENAKKLYDNVKSSINNFLADLDFTINFEFETIEKEDLQELVSECMKEIKNSEIVDMTEQELIALLEASRKETEALFTEELKDLYYQNRYEEIIQEKCDAILTQLENSQVFEGVKTALETAYTNITSQISSMKDAYIDNFLDPESAYQQAKQEYIEAKKALLEARLEGLVNMAQIEQTLALMEQNLENVEEMAENIIEGIETTMNSALATFNTMLNQISSFINEDTINAAIEDAKTNFKSAFQTTYATYIENNNWNDLNPNTQA